MTFLFPYFYREPSESAEQHVPSLECLSVLENVAQGSREGKIQNNDSRKFFPQAVILLL